MLEISKKSPFRRFLIPTLFLCFIALITPSCDDNVDISKCYVKKIGDGKYGKYLIHLEGSPYEMGYAMGIFRPDAVERICSSEYYVAVVKYIAGDWVDYIADIDWLVDTIIAGVKGLTLIHENSVPDEYIEEMRGIADGVTAVKPDTELEYTDILMLNMSMDVVFSLLYQFYEPQGELCNGFVAHGGATVDGNVFLGRHFMYPDEVFSEEALIVEYYPENGNSFVSVTTPGFVGATSAMNSQAIGIGVNKITSSDASYFCLGMGSLLLVRDVIQYSDTLIDGIEKISNAQRGVAWAYIIGDGKNGGSGAILETTASNFMVRDSEWVSPVGFEPDQIETKSDVVAVANHFLIPEMSALETLTSSTSMWRYPTMVNLLLDAYGNIDADKAREIIDFMHPPGEEHNYYESGQDVAASVTLFDLTNLRLWTLIGNYDDPWAYSEL